jgi:hypothetical protein
MATRTVNPETVRTLRDWAARWPKAGNLGFDPEKRNPVIYSRDGTGKKLKEIPWKREADTLTVLSQREKFSGAAIGAAERRMAKYREQRLATATAAAEQVRVAEAALLETWRAYRSAEGGAGGRGALLRDVMAAERALRELEAAVGAQLQPERKPVDVKDAYTTVQVPALPRALRGMELTEVESDGSGSGSNSTGSGSNSTGSTGTNSSAE